MSPITTLIWVAIIFLITWMVNAWAGLGEPGKRIFNIVMIIIVILLVTYSVWGWPYFRTR